MMETESEMQVQVDTEELGPITINKLEGQGITAADIKKVDLLCKTIFFPKLYTQS